MHLSVRPRPRVFFLRVFAVQACTRPTGFIERTRSRSAVRSSISAGTENLMLTRKWQTLIKTPSRTDPSKSGWDGGFGETRRFPAAPQRTGAGKSPLRRARPVIQRPKPLPILLLPGSCPPGAARSPAQPGPPLPPALPGGCSPLPTAPAVCGGGRSPPPAPGPRRPPRRRCRILRINHRERAAGSFPSGKNKQVKINK